MIRFSYLLGEPDLVPKYNAEDAGLSCSSQVKMGEGLIVVVALSMNSQTGIFLQHMNTKE